MKAVQVHQWGQPVQVEDIPQPTPGNDEVLVRVYAASLNPVDAASVAGYLQSMQQLPFTPGTDLAGEVVATGSDVTHIGTGDSIFGMILIRGGAFAEYAVPKGHEVALKPQSVDYVQAAAVPLAGLAAWQTLIDFAQVASGERVLIHGAAGSVGSYAVQLAKDRGAYVIASDMPGKEAFLQELGADQILNAQTQRFEKVVGKVDIVLNYASDALLERSYSVLKSDGRYATTLAQPPREQAESLGIRTFGVVTKPTINHLTQLAGLIDLGKLKPFVNRTFPLEKAQAALDYRQSGTAVGKVVLTIY